jgi:porin
MVLASRLTYAAFLLAAALPAAAQSPPAVAPQAAETPAPAPTSAPAPAPASAPTPTSAPALVPGSPSIAPDLKQQLERAGIKLNLFLTGLTQGQASGSDGSADINALTNRGTGTGIYGGARFDALLELDSTQLGLWRGGQIHAHLEAENGQLPGWRGDAFWPVSTAAILPLRDPGQWSLSSLYLRQGWGGTRLILGKINVIDLQSQSPFFGGWGFERFQNLALVLPPTGVTPVTLMAASLSQRIGELTFTAMAYDPNDRTENTFNRLFADGVNVSLSAQWNGRLWQRSSNLGLAYITSSVKSVSLEETYLPSQLRQRGLISPDNLTFNFGHQLWPSAVRPGKGTGIYGRAGVTSGDPNPIQSSFVIGISGEGMWRSRPWDGFGIGVYRYNWTSGLSTALLTPLRGETGVEMYYNFALTPWLSLSPNLQYIRPATDGAPMLTVFGLRSVARF